MVKHVWNMCKGVLITPHRAPQFPVEKKKKYDFARIRLFEGTRMPQNNSYFKICEPQGLGGKL